MDGQEQLRAYTLQIVALGQAALAIYRRGDWLPEELAALADDLLALELSLGATAHDVAFDEPEMPEEWAPPPDEAPEIDAAPNREPMVSEIALAEPQSAGELAPLFISAPDDGDDWLQSLVEEPPAPLGVAIPADDVLVLDVEEEAGGGLASIAAPIEALPPLVITVAEDLPLEDGSEPAEAVEERVEEVAEDEQVAEADLPAAADEPAPEDDHAPLAPPAVQVLDQPETLAETEVQLCASCGTPLRPGKRFCYQCGAPVAAAREEYSSPPPAPPPTPLSEMPTMLGGPYRGGLAGDGSSPAWTVAPAGRFCNNCGLGVAPDVNVCPDCGSHDIG